MGLACSFLLDLHFLMQALNIEVRSTCVNWQSYFDVEYNCMVQCILSSLDFWWSFAGCSEMMSIFSSHSIKMHRCRSWDFHSELRQNVKTIFCGLSKVLFCVLRIRYIIGFRDVSEQELSDFVLGTEKWIEISWFNCSFSSWQVVDRVMDETKIWQWNIDFLMIWRRILIVLAKLRTLN